MCILWLWVKQWRNRSNWWLRPREILIRASTHKTNAASLHTTYHTMHTEQHTPLHTTLIIKHFTAHHITLHTAQISKHTYHCNTAHYKLHTLHLTAHISPFGPVTYTLRAWLGADTHKTLDPWFRADTQPITQPGR